MKIDFRVKVGNLEVCPNQYIDGKESDSLDIGQWDEKEEFKWVVASFRYDEVDDCFYIKECCDRLSDKNLNWSTFGYLVNLGRKYLELIKDIS